MSATDSRSASCYTIANYTITNKINYDSGLAPEVRIR